MINLSNIVFQTKPTIGYFDVSEDQLYWKSKVLDDDMIFQHFEQSTESDGFTFYYHENILMIPDPKPSPHVHWDNEISLCGNQKIDCPGTFIACFHFEIINDVIVASSLTIAEFEHLKAGFSVN